MIPTESAFKKLYGFLLAGWYQAYFDQEDDWMREHWDYIAAKLESCRVEAGGKYPCL